MSDGEDEDDEGKNGKLVEGKKHSSTAMKRKGYNNIDHKPVANIKYIHGTRRTREWSPIRKATGSRMPKSSNLGVKHQFLAFLFMIDDPALCQYRASAGAARLPYEIRSMIADRSVGIDSGTTSCA